MKNNFLTPVDSKIYFKAVLIIWAVIVVTFLIENFAL